MLLEINHQHARHQLDLMSKDVAEGNSPGKERQVSEDAFAKRNIKRDGLRSIENNFLSGVVSCSKLFSREHDLEIRDPQLWFVDDHLWNAIGACAESYFPWAFAAATMFNPTVRNRIYRHCDKKGRYKMFGRVVL